MSHYEKVAIVALRVAGCCVAVVGLVGAVFSLVLNLLRQESAGIYFYSSLTYLLIGLVLFALSKPLAALIAGRL
ncbi:MAG TPA: hypothetical protein VF528_04240 [Pyrinomonadaceae bacterium]|jgi:CubicO group peptidase (beta-lactamase class C family)